MNQTNTNTNPLEIEKAKKENLVLTENTNIEKSDVKIEIQDPVINATRLDKKPEKIDLNIQINEHKPQLPTDPITELSKTRIENNEPKSNEVQSEIKSIDTSIELGNDNKDSEKEEISDAKKIANLFDTPNLSPHAFVKMLNEILA